MSLIKVSVKGSALLCEELDANWDYVLDLANATGELNCSKINSASLNTCLSETSVINSINSNITNNSNVIGEVAQDLADVQSLLQSNIDAITTLVNNQNATIAEQAQQIADLVNSFNTLNNTVSSFNSRLLSIEGRIITLELGIAMGIIVVWSGLTSAIPISWQLCDGTNNTPDLRNRFIVGAGSLYSVDSVGGTINHTHTLSGTSNATTLTVSQMPAHTHTVNDPGHSHIVGGYAFFATGSTFESRAPGRPGDNWVNPPYANSTLNTTNISVASAGSNGGHTHGFSTTTATTNNLPPYYALAYIMKI